MHVHTVSRVLACMYDRQQLGRLWSSMSRRRSTRKLKVHQCFQFQKCSFAVLLSHFAGRQVSLLLVKLTVNMIFVNLLLLVLVERQLDQYRHKVLEQTGDLTIPLPQIWDDQKSTSKLLTSKLDLEFRTSRFWAPVTLFEGAAGGNDKQLLHLLQQDYFAHSPACQLLPKIQYKARNQVVYQ